MFCNSTCNDHPIFRSSAGNNGGTRVYLREVFSSERWVWTVLFIVVHLFFRFVSPLFTCAICLFHRCLLVQQVSYIVFICAISMYNCCLLMQTVTYIVCICAISMYCNCLFVQCIYFIVVYFTKYFSHRLHLCIEYIQLLFTYANCFLHHEYI